MFKRMGTFRDEERKEMEHFEEHMNYSAAKNEHKAQAAGGMTEGADETLQQLTDRDAEWRKELRAAMKPKERKAIKRVIMHRRSKLWPDSRNGNQRGSQMS